MKQCQDSSSKKVCPVRCFNIKLGICCLLSNKAITFQIKINQNKFGISFRKSYSEESGLLSVFGSGTEQLLFPNFLLPHV